MKSFTDGEGRPWRVNMDDAAVDRAREIVGIDLRNEDEFKLLAHDGPNAILRLAYVVCQAEAEARGMDLDDFRDAMPPTAYADALFILWDATIQFWPPDQQVRGSHLVWSRWASLRELAERDERTAEAEQGDDECPVI